MSNAWFFSVAVSIDCYFYYVWAVLSYFFASLKIICGKLDTLNNIIWPLSINQVPPPPQLFAATALFVYWLFLNNSVKSMFSAVWGP